MADAAASPAPRASTELHGVVIRSYPKVVFLYPTFFAALAAGLWTLFSDPSSASLTPGRLFWWVFAFNLFALGFDFTRGSFFALVLFFLVTCMSIFLLDERFDLVRPVQDVLSRIRLQAHPHFYLMLGFAIGAVLLLVFVETRFDYWEVTHNELLHHHGFLGNVERFPAPSLRMTKEITDVFEFWLLSAGTLVLQPQGSPRAFVLENVIGVNRIEERVQRLLATLAVKVEHAKEDA